MGKGTQAKALAGENGWLHLSTGDLFRDHIRRQTELGRKVKSILDSGAYVPDDVTVDMVRERLAEIPGDRRIVFDGFPRTAAQADALDRLLAERGRRIGGVLLLEAPREELRKRLEKRAKAEGRTDDTPEVIASRLEKYERETRPLVAHYEAKGLTRRVDGLGSIDEVTERLRDAAERHEVRT